MCVCGCNWTHNLKGQRPIWCEISREADSVTRLRITLGMYTSKDRRGGWCFFLKSRTWTLRFCQGVECSRGIFQSIATSNLFPSLFLSPSMTTSCCLFVFDSLTCLTPPPPPPPLLPHVLFSLYLPSLGAACPCRLRRVLFCLSQVSRIPDIITWLRLA